MYEFIECTRFGTKLYGHHFFHYQFGGYIVRCNDANGYCLFHTWKCKKTYALTCISNVHLCHSITTIDQHLHFSFIWNRIHSTNGILCLRYRPFFTLCLHLFLSLLVPPMYKNGTTSMLTMRKTKRLPSMEPMSTAFHCNVEIEVKKKTKFWMGFVR